MVHRTLLFCCGDPWTPAGPSGNVTVFLGTVWSSIKEVNALFMFDGYQGIALLALQLNRASSCGKGKSHDFSLVASRTWDIFSHDIMDGLTKVMLVQRHQESCLVERDSSAFSSRHGSEIGTTNGGKRRPRFPFKFPQVYWDSYSYSRRVRHHLILKLLSPRNS